MANKLVCQLNDRQLSRQPLSREENALTMRQAPETYRYNDPYPGIEKTNTVQLIQHK